jgi:hypothetical protein
MHIAFGQYVMYRELLALLKPDATLYRAVPDPIFTAFGTTILNTIRNNRVKIIVVNIETEDIPQWIE